MRYFVCIVLGLLMGSLGTISAMNILAAQRDPYPDSLMNVMKHELATATEAAAQPACNENRQALEKLTMLGNDIIVAMPDGDEPDRVFHQYIKNLKDKVALARDSDCADRKQAMTDIKNACNDCHRDYR